MNSLFYVLTDQHRDEFAPVRCNGQTVARLVRSFEDVVTENKLSPLVIEGRCLTGDPSHESRRLQKLASASRRLYQFTCDAECASRTWEPGDSFKLISLEEKDFHTIETGPFILVIEPRFCGLLSSWLVSDERKGPTTSYEMVWTFDPNVVFTGIEYLISRIGVHRPQERDRLASLLNACTPRSSSLRLALAFTTKLTLLMQRQNELEMATNRISSAISSTLELENILQSAVEEVGSALNAKRAALLLRQEGNNLPEGMSIYERPDDEPYDDGAPAGAVGLTGSAHGSLDPGPPPGLRPEDRKPGEVSLPMEADKSDDQPTTPCSLEIPISYRDSPIGVLIVEDDTPNRNWEDEEVLMVRTVSDQLSVAISHARLFRQVQTEAMTDALTGLFNHRYFQERLDREVKLADRNNDSVSLILLDLDHLKHINDTHGHRSGDAALCHVAGLMKSAVRNMDICARYGGEEFVVILPQCDRESAMIVADRARQSIASTPVPRVGQVTASVGVATYPSGAKSKDELIEMADRAMYLAKAAGRNRVRTLAHRTYTNIDFK